MPKSKETISSGDDVSSDEVSSILICFFLLKKFYNMLEFESNLKKGLRPQRNRLQKSKKKKSLNQSPRKKKRKNRKQQPPLRRPQKRQVKVKIQTQTKKLVMTECTR